jgi:hypothetical protein
LSGELFAHLFFLCNGASVKESLHRRPPAMAFPEDTIMTKDQKIIRAKAGVLELAKQLGNVSQVCKMMAALATMAKVLREEIAELADDADTFKNQGGRSEGYDVNKGNCQGGVIRFRRRG